MSYEGYEQVLCENGHYFTFDCYDYWQEDKWVCPICGAKSAWSNMVDVTNGSFENDAWGELIRIDGYVSLKVKDECKCECCGTVLERRYKIPTEEEMKKSKPWRYEDE